MILYIVFYYIIYHYTIIYYDILLLSFGWLGGSWALHVVSRGRSSTSSNTSHNEDSNTWTPKVCKIMAFMAVILGLGLLFYILLGFR